MTDPTPAPYVRPDVRAFLDYLNALPGPRAHEQEPTTAREQVRAMRGLVDLDRGELAVVRDLVAPGPAGDVPCRLYDPRPSRPPGPLVMFYHGGGFVLGDLESHDAVCAAIARGLDLPLLAVDYRLAPEAPYPAAPDDCEAATRWVADGRAGIAATGLVVAGDSAGGNLAAITALALRDEPAGLPVIAQWLIYPLTDTRTHHPSHDLFGEGYFLTHDGMVWFGRNYAADNSHWRASPNLAPLAGLPPTLIVTAGLDPLRDQGRAYAAALIQAGVPTIFREAAGTIHGFLTLRRAIPSAEGDLQSCLAALKPMILEAEAARAMAAAA